MPEPEEDKTEIEIPEINPSSEDPFTNETSKESNNISDNKDIKNVNQFYPPSNRHNYYKIKDKTPVKEKTTIFGSNVDVDADVKAINLGNAEKIGNDYKVNGRVYGVTDKGELFPRYGEDLYSLDRGGLNALKTFKKFGNTQRAYEIIGFQNIKKESIDAALEVYNLFN